MSLPAALTWLQLLPNGMRFSCANAPAWFETILRQHANVDAVTSHAAVMWGKPWSDAASEAAKADAVVAINCPHVTTSRLIGAGHSYARRFAVLPSLEKARWFICLDTANVAAASFSLYTPSRKSAHVKKAVARMLAKLRVPGWYRDEIIIACRETPPLEAKIGGLFPGHTIRLALSSGAPEPAINRKPSASVIDSSGDVLAFVKIAASKVSREIVEHEAEILAGLALRDVKVTTPRLLFAGEVDGRYVAVQSPLPGAPATAALTPQHKSFLAALRGAEKPLPELNMVATLRPRLAAITPPRPDLGEVFDCVLPIVEQRRVPSTIVHGDFAPWNLRIHDGRLAAFDWEYGELDGLPFVDELHFLLQAGLELEKWDIDAATAFLCDWRDREGDPLLAGSIEAFYLLDQLARLLGEGYSREHDMVVVYDQLLRRLVPVNEPEAALV